MNRFLAALALLLLAAVPAAAQTNVVWGLATGANPRNLCVYDSTHTCVTTGALDSTLHVFTPNNGTSGATLCLLNANCTWSGAETFSAGVYLTAATIADVYARPAPAVNGAVTYVSSYYAAGSTPNIGDKGGGQFVWSSSSTATDDACTVLNPTGHSGNGRWLRQFQKPWIEATDCGAKGDGTSDDGPPTRAAMTYAGLNGRIDVHFPGSQSNYLIASKDPSGLGALVIGDGTTYETKGSMRLVGDAYQINETPNNNYQTQTLGQQSVIRLGAGLNVPLVFVRQFAPNPEIYHLVLDGNGFCAVGQTGCTVGQTGPVTCSTGYTCPWPTATFQGYMTGGNLYVTSVTNGAVVAGQTISASGITGTPVIATFSGTGTYGGVGTYTTLSMQTLGSSGSPVTFTAIKTGFNARLYTVMLEDAWTGYKESGVTINESMIWGGYSGNLYIGQWRGSNYLRYVWMLFSGQNTGDAQFVLNGPDTEYDTLAVGGGTGYGIYVQAGDQNHFRHGAVWLNNVNVAVGTCAESVTFDNANMDSSIQDQIQDNGFSSSSNCYMATGTFVPTRTFTDMQFTSGGTSSFGTYSAFYVSNDSYLNVNHPNFKGTDWGAATLKYAFACGGTCAVQVSNPQYKAGVSTTTDFTNDYSILTTPIYGDVAQSSNKNAPSLNSLTNNSTGTGASAAFQASNGASIAQFGIAGPNYGGYAGIVAGSSFIYSSSASGIVISANVAGAPVSIYQNGTLIAQVNSSGVFEVKVGAKFDGAITPSSGVAGVSKTCTTYPTVSNGIVTGC